MSGLEVLPIKSEIFIPENKVSAWVSNKNDAKKDPSKEHQGRWVVDEYYLDKKKAFTEVWIFYDNDDLGIDDRVLINNPLQGRWGYAPGVNPRKADINDMWFFPPKSAKCKIPAAKEEYNHKGTWVKPIFKRDFSQLGANSSGFLNVSGNMRIAKGEKHSVAGKWNMLGYNDNVVRGRKKPKNDDDDDGKGPWQIYVRKPDDSRFPLTVIPGNKISACKTKIFKKKGIPIQDQRLSFNDVPLKDEKTLVGSGIRNGDTINLGPMIVYVRTRRGKKFTFEVDPDEMVEKFKPLVEKREGTPVDEQRLYHKNKKLIDGKPLSDFNVRHKSTIDLGPMVIFVQPLGKESKIELDVEPTDTLKSVKVKVKNRLKMPVAEQRLSFQDTEMLSDSKNLDSYGVRHLDTLYMFEESKNPTMIIFVLKEWNNHKFKLKTDPTNTILDVKKMIEASENIPVDQQRLTFKKKSVYNAKTLEQSKIKNRDTLVLSEPRRARTVPVYPDSVDLLLPDRSKIKIPVKPSTTFADIKDHIEGTNNIPRHKQRIFYMDEDNEPDEESPIFKPDLGVYEPITLQLEQDPEPIEIKTPDGRTFFFDFDPNDTFDDLKKKIALNVGQPAKGLKLRDINGDIVDELPSSGATLTVDPPHIDVVLPDKSKVTLQLLPKMTIDDLKDVIEDEVGVPKADQRIFFFDDDGDELDGNTPIGKAGLKAGSVLEMRSPPPEENNITLKLPNRNFVFDFDPDSDTLDDIKRKIAHKLGLPIKDLPPLMMDDEELDDNYRPSKGDILDFEPTEMEIELPNGRRVKLATLPIQSIGEIKDIVEEKTGVKRSNQRMFHFDNADEELDDDDMLMKARMQPGEPLKIFSRVESKEPGEINIKDPSGRLFQLVIDPDDPDVGERIREKIGMPIGGFKLADKEWEDDDDIPPEEVGNMVRNGGVLQAEPPEIVVALPNSKKIRLQIMPTMTMRDVMELIEEEAPELSSSQSKKLFFLEDTQALEDETPFAKLNFEHGQTLELRSMMINIQLENGDNIKLDVQTDWYIDDVRDQLYQITSIPVEQQHFLFDGKAVNEQLTLIAQGIVHGSTLSLEPMSVYVNTPFRKKPLHFVTKRTETVDALRRRVLKKNKKGKDASSKNFCLVVGGQELRSNKTLEECNVQHGDVLDLEKFKLRIMHWDSYRFEVDGVKRKDSLATLKQIIFELEGIPVKVQRLSLNGRPLVDKKTLLQENVNHRAILTLEQPTESFEMVEAEKRNIKTTKKKNFQSVGEDEIMPCMPDWKRRIFIFDYDDHFDAHVELVIMHWTGEKFTLANILLKQKVRDIKRLIYKLRKIEKKKQIIKFNGKLLNDKRTLLEYGVGHRSILVLESPSKNKITTPNVERLNGIFGTLPTKFETNITITVRHRKKRGDSFELTLGPNEYIDDVKDLIYDQTGLPLESIRLSFNDQATQDDKNLKEHGIVDGSVLVLEPMKIFLLLSKKKSICLNVEMGQRICALKKKVAKKSRLPFDLLSFVFGGVELDDSKTLSDYGIDHEDEIQVEMFEIRIMHWSGTVFSVNGLSPNSTAYDVKLKISEKNSSIPIKRQVLVLKGQVLNDILRLKDQGVHHKAVLILEPPDERVISPVKEKVRLGLFDTSAGEGDKIDGFPGIQEGKDMDSSDDSLSISTSSRSSSRPSSQPNSLSTEISNSDRKKASKEKKKKEKKTKMMKGKRKKVSNKSGGKE